MTKIDKPAEFDPCWTPDTPTEAFDALSAVILVADTDMFIRYANPSAITFFSAIETDIQKDMPHFRVDEIVGKNVDYFHANPGYQRGLMTRLRTRHIGKIRIGGKVLALVVSPVIDAQGDIRSYVLECQDLTAYDTAQRQMNTLIASVNTMATDHARGNIHTRVAATGLDVDYQEIADRVNTMIVGHIAVQDEIIDCMRAVAVGELDAISTSFEGDRSYINTAIDEARTAFQGAVMEIQQIASDLAEGRFDRKLDMTQFKGAYADIVTPLISAMTGLNDTISGLQEQILQVSDAVGQISSSAQMLSHAAQTQSYTVDEISSVTEQTDAAVAATASQTKTMITTVSTASRYTSEGLNAVGDLVTAMAEIRSSSSEIAKIIKVIDEIAFQTNLLALNAAVEAARAGEHGRGFAVVAQEVRNLAGRAAKAARETSDLIDIAERNVASGAGATDASEAGFKKIYDEIKVVKQGVDAINQASEEQSVGVRQITASVSQLSRTGGDVAAQAEELAAAAAQMDASTQTMREMVGRFKLAPSSVMGQTYPATADDITRQIMAMLAQNAATGAAHTPRQTDRATDKRHVNIDPRGYARF